MHLLTIPLRKFRRLQDARFKPTRAYRLRRKVWGEERTLLITFSPELQRKQRRGIEQHLAKKHRVLQELQAKLRRSQKPGAKGKSYTRESLAKHICQIVYSLKPLKAAAGASSMPIYRNYKKL